MAKFPIMVVTTATLGNNNFRMAPNSSQTLGWTTNSGFRNMPMPIPATVSQFYMRLATAPTTATSTRTFRIRKNETNDNIIAAFTASDTSVNDLSNTNSYAIGDSFDLLCSVANTPVDSVLNRWGLQFEAANQILHASTSGSVSTTANRYVGIQDHGGSATAATNNPQTMPTDGTFRNLYVNMSGTITTGSYAVTLYKNGVATSITASLTTSGVQASDTTHSVSFVAGDSFYYEVVPSAGTAPSTARGISFGLEFVPTVAGEAVLLGSSNAVLDTTTNYNTWYISGANTFDTTEANRQAFGMNCTVKKLRVDLSAAPGVGNTRTVTFRKAGVSTSLAVTVSDANTSGSTSTDVSVSTGDLVGIMHGAVGATNARVRWGIVYRVDEASSAGFFLVV